MDSDEFLDDSFEESLREIETSDVVYSTPPPSAAKRQLQQDAPLFTCVQEVEELRDCSKEGPVGRGLLSSIIHLTDPFPNQFTDPVTSLFGIKVVVHQAFSRDLSQNFLLFRYQLNTLMNCADPGQANALISHSTTFLSILECFVHRQLACHSQHQQPHPLVVRIAADLAAHLLRVWSQVDPPSTDSPTRFHHWAPGKDLLHLTLHLHWTTVAVLYRVSQLLGPSTLLEHVHLLCRSLLYSAATRYNQWAKLDVSSPRKTFFICSCIREVWLLIMYVTDTLSLASNTQSFWCIVTQILSNVLSHHTLSCMEDQSLAVKLQDPVGFAWWVLVSLCPLYSYSEDGRSHPMTLQNKLKPCWAFLQDLLPLAFHQDVTEKQLRTYMMSYLFLVHHWPAAVEHIVLAWDHFHKHMSDSFHVVGRGIQEWLVPEHPMPQQWVHHIKGLCSTANGRDQGGVATSYDHFLCILATTLTRSHDQEHMWKQLRGRFYSKIHSKWLEGLGLAGVSNFISLLLVLAWSGDTAEISQKSVTYLCTLGLCAPKDKTTVLVWKGLLAMLMVCEEKSVSFCSIVEKTSPSVASLTQVFLSGSEEKQLCWEVICLLLDASLELLQGSGGVAIGSGLLLGSCLGNLITSLQGHELVKVLQCVEGVAVELCSQLEILQRQSVGSVEVHQQAESVRGYCRIFLQSCIPGLLIKTKLPIPPPQLAASAAAVTSLACKCSSLAGVNISSLADALFEECALKDTTVASLACSYICHLGGGADATRQLLQQSEGVQWKVAHTWFRAVLQMHSTPSCVNSVQELSEVLVDFPVISALLQSSDCHAHDTQSVLCALLSSINTAYLAAGDPHGAMSWRDKMATLLGDLLFYMEPALSGSAPGDSLKQCYCVASYLVELCPKVIYGKAQTARWCVLPQLVDRLFFPVHSTSKPIVQGVSVCTHLHLHQFLAGLLQLDPHEDGFIKRKVQRLFSQYFLACIQPKQPVAAGLSSNPFMLLLRPCMDHQEPSPDVCERLLHVLMIVTSGFLVLPQQPISLLPTIKFLRQVIERVRCGNLLVRCLPVVLGSLLSCHLACEVCSRQSEPHGIRRLVMDILRILLVAYKQHPDILPPDSIRPLLRDFIATNIKQFGGTVFKTLQLLSELHSHFVASVLEDACQLVERHEVRSGMAGGLRAAYEALVLDVRNKVASGDI